MPEKLVFDTLAYAKMLQKGGVENEEIHAQSLATALNQNIYLKYEVDKMFEESLKRFDERTRQMTEEFRAEIHRLELEMKDIRLEIAKTGNRVIAILSSLIILAGSLSTLFIHNNLPH